MRCQTAVAATLLASLLAACAGGRTSGSGRPDPTVADLLAGVLPADALLLGEQHDAPDHPRWQHAAVAALAAQGRLAALALEMAPAGTSTAGLAPDADDPVVQAALRWDARAWPWSRYGPVVMTAVRAGVPVLGANLPQEGKRNAMLNIALDDHLTPGMWQKQQKSIREGHCGLLPEARIVPMTRVQIARDAAMAATVLSARQPGRTVLLIAGNQHVDRTMGVPTHLGAAIAARSVALRPAGMAAPAVDKVWATAAVPAVDHCAALRRQWDSSAASPR